MLFRLPHCHIDIGSLKPYYCICTEPRTVCRTVRTPASKSIGIAASIAFALRAKLSAIMGAAAMPSSPFSND